jgi:hypothetical protein
MHGLQWEVKDRGPATAELRLRCHLDRCGAIAVGRTVWQGRPLLVGA